MLHLSRASFGYFAPSENVIQQKESTVTHSHHSLNAQESRTILATAQVFIQSSNGLQLKFRALIDPGSQSRLITRAAAALLKLPFKKCNTSIKGVGNTPINSSKYIVSCIIKSIHNPDFNLAIETLVLNKLTDCLLSTNLPELSASHLKYIPLADPNYFYSGKIYLLVGSELCYDLFIPEIRKGLTGVPVAQNTMLGWIGVGKSS